MRKFITDSFTKFTTSEKNAGLFLVMCAIISLLIVNSTIGNSYTSFWHHVFTLNFFNHTLSLSPHQVINDGLMSVFFLLVGLEIKRELLFGELYPIKNALMPLFMAVGGMLMPALIFTLLNYNTPTVNGFGIPMGTDIAFALAALSFVLKKVPIIIKVLLTAIAIIDDLGSIIVIALCYGSAIHYQALGVALVLFIALLLLNKLGVQTIILYLLLGSCMWYFMMQSGIHPTLSGVLLAFAIPIKPTTTHSPALRLQHALHLPVAFIILPLFTLANTAIPFKAEYLQNLASAPTFGICLGLLIGKPLGIMLSLYTIIKLRITQMPIGMTWRDIMALGFLAGIGFTMSIFITQLAFITEILVQSSKLMILITSVLAGITGLVIFTLNSKK